MLSEWFRKHKRRYGGVISMGDEVFSPLKYEAALEIGRETRMPAPAPLAGDDDKGIWGGKIVITVEEEEESAS